MKRGKPAQARYKNGEPVKTKEINGVWNRARDRGADMLADADGDMQPKYFEMDPGFDTCLDGVDVDSDDFNPLAYMSLRQGETIPPLPLPKKLSEWLDEEAPIYNDPGQGRNTLLTKGKMKRLLHFIRNGCFDYVACEAVGVVPITFYRWLRDGKDPSNKFHDFYVEVLKARAIARAGAEMTIRKENPQAWLRYGPGRDKPGRPGWTESTQQQGVVEHKVSMADIIKQSIRIKQNEQLQLPPGPSDVLEKVDDGDVWS